MTPGVMLVAVVVWLACAFAGQVIGKAKGYPGAGFAIGFLLGVLGVIIVALLPKTEAVKAAEARRGYEAQVAAAQWQYQIQAEAARRAGYPFPPQPPQGPWQPPQGPWQPPQEPWQPPQEPWQPPQEPQGPAA